MEHHIQTYELGLISKECKDEHALLFIAAFIWRRWVF